MIHWSVSIPHTLVLVFHHKEKENYSLASQNGKILAIQFGMSILLFAYHFYLI